MRKKIFAVMIAAVIAMFAGYNIYQSQSSISLSDLALTNVEALASFEVGDMIDNCVWSDSSYCYYIIVTPNGNTVWEHSNMRNS